MNDIIELLEKAEHQVLNTCASSQDKQEISSNINEALGIYRKQSGFLELFEPITFNSKDELLDKAKTFDISLWDKATIISYFVHVAGKICRESNTRLFYLKCDLSPNDIESLADHIFKPSFGHTNVYLASNGFHGSLLIVENTKDIS